MLTCKIHDCFTVANVLENACVRVTIIGCIIVYILILVIKDKLWISESASEVFKLGRRSRLCRQCYV